MSVTFHCPDGHMITEENYCLCAQMAPCIGDIRPGYLTDEQKAILAEHAHPNCPLCKGTGLDSDTMPERFVNLANLNARKIVDLLGLPDDNLTGSLEVSDLSTYRQRIIRALNMESDRSHLVADSTDEGGPGTGQCRTIFFGNTDEQTRDRLERLLDLFKYAQERNLSVSWS